MYVRTYLSFALYKDVSATVSYPANTYVNKGSWLGLVFRTCPFEWLVSRPFCLAVRSRYQADFLPPGESVVKSYRRRSRGGVTYVRTYINCRRNALQAKVLRRASVVIYVCSFVCTLYGRASARRDLRTYACDQDGQLRN